MGITIHYRGSLADVGRVEDFEDRVIDLALDLGGNVRLWRSADDADRARMVRGLMLDLAPGQETTSLLISPEGWFIGLVDIEDAEKGQLAEPPWCFVKTQFGPIEGHVALVELLAAIKNEFAPDLEVVDEGGYWESRDLAALREKASFVGQALEGLVEALRNDHLSPEALEDPAIVATRIERLARLVHRTISRPSEHPPVHFPEDDAGVPLDPAENEALSDELYKENRRRQERMERAIEERRLRGESDEQAFEAAMEDVLPPMDWVDDEDAGPNDEVAELIDEMNEAAAAATQDDEPWQQSLPEAVRSGGDDPFAGERHPLQQQATAFLLALEELGQRDGRRSASLDMLLRNAMEVCGGLAQVLPLPPAYEIDELEAGHSFIQLKRALRGTAFVRGGLFLLRHDGVVDQAEFDEFYEQAGDISTQIIELMRTIREARG